MSLSQASRLQHELFDDSARPENDLPAYAGPSNLFSRYLTTAKSVVRKLKPYLKGEIGRSPAFRYARATFAKLPVAYQRIVTVSPPYMRIILRPVGKIFGLYNPETDMIAADTALADESKFMELYQHELEIGPRGIRTTSRPAGRIKKPSLMRVLGEEIVHYAQKSIGAIDRYVRRYGRGARDYIEGAASVVSDDLFGPAETYPEEREKFTKLARRIGYRNALEGRALPQAA